MHDFNDLFYYAMVVEHGGFAPAGRAIGVPKSKLSRRIALLEEQLGVRLIQRSTRRFAVSELGQLFFARCKAMLEEAEAAHALVALNQAEPCGALRLTCTTDLLAGGVSRMIASYVASHPRVNVQLKAFNRPVDLIAEGFDVAVRHSSGQLNDSELVQRVLARRRRVLIASPQLLATQPPPSGPADISTYPTLDFGSTPGLHEWVFERQDGAKAKVRHEPHFLTDDVYSVVEAARRGAGLAMVPLALVRDDVRDGRLVQVLPEWNCPEQVIHAVLPSRRHMLPSVRALIDHLVEQFATMSLDEQSDKPAQ
ncbi:LysR substrate-binding domain-containing protein [Stenotrophomonas sp. NPDC077659]|uniref:LysR substrate-binding domain-containing protein n=1 Tax=Stenotrophomonas sp. NPDC077659 TaxID=3390694 RepID=UPI003D031030